jgi:carbon storage regulator CsrA
MKLFLQAANDAIVINHHITVTVESIDGDEVRFSIDAPPWVNIEDKSEASEPGRQPTLAAVDGE